MKGILLPLLGAAAFIVFVGVLTQKIQTGNFSVFPTPTQPKQVKIGKTEITVEIANTEEKRRQGLSGRTGLPENTGMLFVFDKKKIFPSFWMKDMIFSIDIIWISDGKAVKIDKNVPTPAPGTADSQLSLYYPDKPIDYVLEVPAGFSDNNSIQVGDTIILSGAL